MDAERAAKAALLGGDTVQARRLANLSAALDPSNAEALWLLGRIDLREGRTDSALAHLGLAGEAIRCSGYGEPDSGLRRDMALAVGRYARRVLTAPPAATTGHPKLFDCFLFNNELRLLDLHLEEADDFVDGFVIVEAAETFTGQPKPLHFHENRARYAKYAGRIRHVVARPAPRTMRYPWMREFWQRNHIVEGLGGLAADDDYVITGDCDEIPSRQFLAGIRKDFAVLKMRNYRYFLNYLRVSGKKRHWFASAIARFRYVRATSASELRSFAARDLGWSPDHSIDDAGWHFSSAGDAEMVRAKIEAYSHQENLVRGKVDRAKIEKVIDRIRGGLFERGWVVISPDVDAPVTVARNPGRFADLIAPVDTQALSDQVEYFVHELQQVTHRRPHQSNRPGGPRSR